MTGFQEDFAKHMARMLAYAAPFALLLPLLGQSLMVSAVSAAEAPDYEKPPEAPEPPVSFPPAARGTSPLDALYAQQTARQIRIERRVVVRVSPQRDAPRNDLLANLPRQSLNSKFEERKMDKCLPVTGIAGVQTGSGNRLLLFLRDQRIISVNLEKACRARDFYSGFYVEKNEDGKLCVARDKLQSRSGAKCEVERMRQLVAIED